jgi:dihydropteroate synthase
MPHPRHRFDWQLRTRALPLGHRTLIMGILNVTPDSFSDGGHFYSPNHETDRALTHALRMLDQGADLLDLGGESTRPNATPISPSEEQARILPVLEAILKERPHTTLSIDTYHASTARAAITAGAEIINDVSGLLWDPLMPAACADLACGLVLMHTRGRPHDWPSLPPLAPNEVLPLILTDLARQLAIAQDAGIERNRIVLDPGFGFGKIGSENLTLLAHLAELQPLGLPILSGTSRKGFLTKALETAGIDPTPEARLHATNATSVAAILSGAHLLRVHDVLSARAAATLADATLNAISGTQPQR